MFDGAGYEAVIVLFVMIGIWVVGTWAIELVTWAVHGAVDFFTKPLPPPPGLVRIAELSELPLQSGVETKPANNT